MFRSRTLRIVILAAGILAFSASAAQARPMQLGYTDDSRAQSQSPSTGYQTIHRLYGAQIAETYFDGQSPPQVQVPWIGPHDRAYARWAKARGFQVIGPADNSANWSSRRPSPPASYRNPVVVTPAQPVAATDSGFNWTAALFGAGMFVARRTVRFGVEVS